MPRCHFNACNDDVTLDDEGADSVDLLAARAHAVTAARSLAADMVRRGHFVGDHRVGIVDADQKLIVAQLFDEAVDIGR